MPTQVNLDYLIIRERQSRELAAESGDIAVRLAHIGMADGYAERIAALNIALGHTAI